MLYKVCVGKNGITFYIRLWTRKLKVDEIGQFFAVKKVCEQNSAILSDIFESARQTCKTLICIWWWAKSELMKFGKFAVENGKVGLWKPKAKPGNDFYISKN